MVTVLGHAPSRALLRGIHALMYFYIPAVFALGHDVRCLTWQGGVTGTVKGDRARRVLQQCLAVQVQLLGDWECRAEYTRTLSVALLQWQPWMTSLDGGALPRQRPAGGVRGHPPAVHHAAAAKP